MCNVPFSLCSVGLVKQLTTEQWWVVYECGVCVLEPTKRTHTHTPRVDLTCLPPKTLSSSQRKMRKGPIVPGFFWL